VKIVLEILWLLICSVAFAWTCVKFAWFVFWAPALPVLIVVFLLLVWGGLKLIGKLRYS